VVELSGQVLPSSISGRQRSQGCSRRPVRAERFVVGERRVSGVEQLRMPSFSGLRERKARAGAARASFVSKVLYRFSGLIFEPSNDTSAINPFSPNTKPRIGLCRVLVS
jgi:hypothetical protein